ncbi:CubicO group peptidase (beta-lactamase class C family) [Sporosarcina luteola]|nr:CubicO group peptidase (beta-lactamase class C family) [Sporosarcina luteola]
MEKVVRFLQKEIDKDVTPGAVIRVRHRGRIVLDEALGYNCLEPGKTNMSSRHVFDMASLTKVMVTLPAMLQLFASGALYLHDKVSTFLPGFGSNGKDQITVKQLLTHSSGLVAHRPYFESRMGKEEVLASIHQETLAYQPDSAVVYSDLGFIILMELIEQLTGQRIDEFAKEHIFQPLSIKDTGYLPVFQHDRYAPTEFAAHLEGHKYGVVHDDNTEYMGGVSGHAGLFSTMDDVAVFTQMLENNGEYEGKRIIDRHWLELSRQNFTPFSNESRGIGWQLKGNDASPAGDLMSAGAYGHTGFTGTSFYIDPERELTVMLLTNRVYFGRHSHMIRLRPRLHNLIVTQLPEEEENACG